MRRQVWIYAAFLTLFGVGWASGGEPPCSEPRPDCFVGEEKGATDSFAL